MTDNNTHVYPINDLQEHVLVGVECPCIPEIDVQGADLIIIHNAFDKREIIEQAVDAINLTDEEWEKRWQV